MSLAPCGPVLVVLLLESIIECRCSMYCIFYMDKNDLTSKSVNQSNSESTQSIGTKLTIIVGIVELESAKHFANIISFCETISGKGNFEFCYKQNKQKDYER